MNEISSKQLYIMIFFIPLVFKMSSLPSIMFAEASSTAYALIGLTALVEFLQLGLVLFVCSHGGMEAIKEKFGKKAYILISLPMLFVVFMKLIVLVPEIVTYICGFMFYNISEKYIIPIVLITVFYIGTRGARAIGRLFELSIWFIPIIIIFGFFFGKIELNSLYLTPLFDKSPYNYLSVIGKYLIFTFDFSPLLFFKVKIKRVTPIAVCSLLSICTVSACFALLYCAYGNASVYANCAFARLATFNTVISEIGGLDWPSTLLWLVTSILSLSLKINAVNRIMYEWKLKKAGTFLFCLSLYFVLTLAVKTINEALSVVTSGVQYGVFAAEIVLPIVIISLLMAKKEKEEYATQN